MRRFIINGLLGFIPILLTYLLLVFAFDFLRFLAKFFVPPAAFICHHLLPPDYYSRVEPFIHIVATGIGVLTILVMGVLLTSLVGRQIQKFFEYIILKTPFVGTIYAASKKVAESLISFEQMGKSNAVVAFRHGENYLLGLQVSEGLAPIHEREKKHTKTVYVLQNPPPSGYVTFVPSENVIPLPISVEDALRIVTSGGILTPPNVTLTKIFRK